MIAHIERRRQTLPLLPTIDHRLCGMMWRMSATPANVLFLKSALRPEGALIRTGAVPGWVAEQNARAKVQLRRCPIRSIPGWRFDASSGRLRHGSGGFFSIDGIRIRTNWEGPQVWDQPIINQPEVGFLGILTQEIDGVLHFLLQAKIEPGNLHLVQLAPTLQATRSNYNRVHHGREPLFLDLFRKAGAEQILLDQLQSEQGARFLRKRNRNIIIKVDQPLCAPAGFLWLTLAQIKTLMRQDNLINMDTRTVISGIPFGNQPADVVELLGFLADAPPLQPLHRSVLRSVLSAEGTRHSIDEIITFLTQLKSLYDLEVEHIPLAELDGWLIDELSIRRHDERFFEVIGVEVEISGREVTRWGQPMVKPAQEGLCAFVVKEINGLLHLAVQAKLECGNHDIVEFAPTVQCLTGNYRQTKSGSLPFLEEVLATPPERIVFDSLQSEEGGRFYQEQNRNLIVIAGDELSDELPPRYIWMTLNQLQTFIRFNNYLNVQARSLIAALAFL